jgi:predicted PurR-regulated permease PerM
MAKREQTRRADIVFALVMGLLAYVFWVLRHTILLIYVSILFAVIFTPVVRRIERVSLGKWHASRGVALLILLAALAAMLGIIFFVVLPPIVHDAQGLAQDLPEQVHQLSQRLQDFPLGRKLAAQLKPDALAQHFTDLLRRVLNAVSGVIGGVMDALILALLSAYFILDGRSAFEWTLSLVPTVDRQRLSTTLRSGAHRAQRWLTGQALLMLILGSLTAVVLGAMHVRYFYALALFAGLANFVPVVGPIVTVALASVAALLDSWLKVLGVVIFYLSYQQVENAYLSPRIMQANVGLSPVVVIISLAIGGALAGVLGALVAVPTAAMIATLVSEYLAKNEYDAPSKHVAEP